MHVMRMRPAAMAADVPTKMPAVIAMGVAVAATHQNNTRGCVDRLERQRACRVRQCKGRNDRRCRNSNSHG